ncbi:MAG: EAL domain-containing protein [Anaerovoracaceae bacterium]
MKKSTFRQATVVVIPILLVIATLISMMAFQTSIVDKNRAIIYDTLKASASQQSQLLQGKLEGQFSILETLADSVNIAHTEEHIIHEIRTFASGKDFVRVGAIFDDGSTYFNDGYRPTPKEEEYYKSIVGQEKNIHFVQDKNIASNNKFLMTVPTENTDGKKSSVVGRFNEVTLRNLLIPQIYNKQGFSFVCDSKGEILIGSEDLGNFKAGGNIFDILDIADFNSGYSEQEVKNSFFNNENGLTAYDTETMEPVYSVYQPTGVNDWYIFNVVPQSIVNEQLQEFTKSGYAAITVTFIASLCLLWFILFVDGRRRRQLEEEKDLLKESENRLRINDEKYKIALENTSISIMEYDFASHCSIQTKHFMEIHGTDEIIENVPESLVEKQYIHPDSAEDLCEMFDKLKDGDEHADGTFLFLRKDRQGYTYEHVKMTTIFNDDGTPYRAIGIFQDVTDKELIKKQYLRELQLKKLVNKDILVTFVLNVSKHIVEEGYTSIENEKQTIENLDFENLFYKLAEGIINNQKIKRTIESINGPQLEIWYKEGKNEFSYEFLRKMLDGKEKWFNFNLHLQQNPKNDELLAFVYISDIDEKKKEMQALEHEARTDSLTGLYNLKAAKALIDDYMRNDGRGKTHAFIMLDLDNFKMINDKFNHFEGNKILKQIASGMIKVLGKNNIISRIGGDEFSAFVKDISSKEQLVNIAVELLNGLQFSMTKGEYKTTVSCSIGIAIVKEGKDYNLMYKEADEALYTAKGKGKNQYVIFSSEEEKEESTIEKIDHHLNKTVQLSALLEYMEGGIVLIEVGETLKSLYFSPSFEKFMGDELEIGDETDNRLLSSILPLDREKFIKTIKEGVQKDGSFELTYRISHRNHNNGWRHFRAVKIPYEESELPVIVAVITDITEQKQTEIQLMEEKQRLSLALEQTNLKIWEYNLVTKKLFLPKENISYNNIPEDAIKEGLTKPECQVELDMMFDQILAKKPSGEAVVKSKYDDGLYYWSKVSFINLFDTNGEIKRTIGVTVKNQEIGLMKTKLEQEEHFLSIFGDTILESFKVNLTRNRVETNAYRNFALEKSYGISDFDQLVDFTKEAMATEEDKQRFCAKYNRDTMLAANKIGNNWSSMEYKWIKPDGHIIWVSITVNMLVDPVTGDVFGFIYAQNIDRIKKYELSLNRKVEIDSKTKLFNVETVQMMIANVIRDNHNSNDLCALVLIGIEGIEIVKEEKGEAVANEAIFNVGRLLTTLLGDQYCMGSISETKLVVFMTDLTSAQKAEERINGIVNYISQRTIMTGIPKEIQLYYGNFIESISTATYTELYEKAESRLNEKIENATLKQVLDKNTKGKKPKEKTTRQQIKPKEIDLDRDMLTGCLSRNKYRELLETFNGSSYSSVGVVDCDVNRYGDSLYENGQEYANKMIVYVAELCISAFGASNVYRVSTDQLIIIATDLSHEVFLEKEKSIKSKFKKKYDSGVSTGATWSDNDIYVNKMVNHAHDFMLLDKQEYYRSEEEKGNKRIPKELSEIKTKISENRFVVYLQPKADMKTGEVIGAEALVRQMDEKGEIIFPDKFISRYESANVIKYLDFFVMAETFNIMSNWQAQGKKMLKIGSNFSRATLLDPTSLKEVEKLKERYSIKTENVEIEITESLGNVERATVVRACDEYISSGFKLTLDDFGSEYSSLSILSAIPFTTLKIDKSLVNNIVTNQASKSVVKTTINLCKELKIHIVAEGVETKEQWDILAEMGCDTAQGYYINKALPLAEFESKFL